MTEDASLKRKSLKKVGGGIQSTDRRLSLDGKRVDTKTGRSADSAAGSSYGFIFSMNSRLSTENKIRRGGVRGPNAAKQV